MNRDDPRWKAVFEAVMEWDGQVDEIRRDEFVDRLFTLMQPDSIRREVAAAVLDAFERANWDTSTRTVDAIAREFGVKW